MYKLAQVRKFINKTSLDENVDFFLEIDYICNLILLDKYATMKYKKEIIQIILKHYYSLMTMTKILQN